MIYGDNVCIPRVSVDFDLPPVFNLGDMNGLKGYAIQQSKNSGFFQNQCMLLGDFSTIGRGLGYDSRVKSLLYLGAMRMRNVRIKIPELRYTIWILSEIALHLEIDGDSYVEVDVYYNGVLYLVVKDSKFKTLSFDLSDEVFRFLQLLDNLETLFNVE